MLAVLASLALVAAACGDDDDTATDDTGGTDDTAAESDVSVCQVSDTGGIDDRSFNQTAWEGAQQAEAELGVEASFLESQSDADFEPNINAFIDQGCDLIVTVGFLLGDATEAAATANPDQDFAIVDFAYEDPPPNVRQLTFDTDQAAFLAGYVAAGMTETGTVGTYGGINIPTVSIFMDGYARGVDYYNEQKGTEVEVLGWDVDTQDGLFTGDFEDQDKGRQRTQTLIDEGADIIMPVAGPVGLGTVAAARDAEGVKVIWVDTDGCVSVPDDCDLFLTSVQKEMDLAVFESVRQVVDGTFEGELYVGTLENDGVTIAPYNEFEDDVPDELKAEVDELRDAIIAGEIPAVTE